MQCPGGTTDHTMSKAKLMAVARKWMQFNDGNPALYADVVAVSDYGACGITGPSPTIGARRRTSRWAAARYTGLVKWCAHSGCAGTPGTYVANGPNVFPAKCSHASGTCASLRLLAYLLVL